MNIIGPKLSYEARYAIDHPQETTPISYEDEDRYWHDEISAGRDRPETDVTG